MGVIWFNGISSDDIGIVVERYPNYTIPMRKLSTQSVDGRNGDLLFSQNAFENVIQTYEIYIRQTGMNMQEVAHKLIEWLFAVEGYQRLEDSYDLDHFRLAYVVGGQKIINNLNRFGRATLEFNCKPQRFLKSGEEAVNITTSPGSVTNPTQYKSAPLVTAVFANANPTYKYVKTNFSDDVFVSVKIAGMSFPVPLEMSYSSVSGNCTNISYTVGLPLATQETPKIVFPAIDIPMQSLVAGRTYKIKFVQTAADKANICHFRAKVTDAAGVTHSINSNSLVYCGQAAQNGKITVSLSINANEWQHVGRVTSSLQFYVQELDEATEKTGTIGIGDYSYTVTAPVNEPVMIDSETMNCYCGSTNLNNKVTLTEYPLIVPGSNAVTFTSYVEFVEIVPRWWEL